MNFDESTHDTRQQQHDSSKAQTSARTSQASDNRERRRRNCRRPGGKQDVQHTRDMQTESSFTKRAPWQQYHEFEHRFAQQTNTPFNSCHIVTTRISSTRPLDASSLVRPFPAFRLQFRTCRLVAHNIGVNSNLVLSFGICDLCFFYSYRVDIASRNFRRTLATVVLSIDRRLTGLKV